MLARLPTLAAMHAMAAPALPVEAAMIVSIFASIARLTTIALARSLKEALGLLLSSLTKSFFNPIFFRKFSGW